ncbi:MAG: hypothetical protein COB98_03515 [Flavobacteriaceae bacterium]|nr:MAG: hypothetical protein COB98_03515 [Flavobacteriaceae bacterium]
MISLNLLLEANLNGLGELIVAIMVGPAILLSIIAIILRLTKKIKASKIFFILAGVYLLISFGFCGVLMVA